MMYKDVSLTEPGLIKQCFKVCFRKRNLQKWRHCLVKNRPYPEGSRQGRKARARLVKT